MTATLDHDTDLPAVTDPRALRDAFGQFPSGVVAVAGRVDESLVGIAASSFTSVSLDPPLVSLCVATSSSTWPRLRAAGQLGVSVLAEDQDAVCRQLAGPAERRFDGLALSAAPGGAVLLDDAVSTFTCTIHSEVEAGDHLVVLLELHSLSDGRGREPLIFHRSGFARLHREQPEIPLSGRINGEPVHETAGPGGGSAEDDAA